MARFIVVFALAIGLMTAAFASAATLTVQGGTVQAGADTTLACAQDPVKVVAWATSNYPTPDEGLDWATIEFSGRDAVSCAGAELAGRLDLTGNTSAYGAQWLNAYHAVPSTFTIPIVATQTQYKMGFYNDAYTQKLYVDPAKIEAIKLWLGGSINN